HQRFNFAGEPVQLPFDGADLLDHRFELAAHKLTALRRQLFPLAPPGPAGAEGLVLELDPQGPPVIFQAAQLLLPELALPAQFARLLLRAAGNPNGPQLVPLAVEVTGPAHTQLPRVQAIILAPAFQVQPQRRGDEGLSSRSGQGRGEESVYSPRPTSCAA